MNNKNLRKTTMNLFLLLLVIFCFNLYPDVVKAETQLPEEVTENNIVYTYDADGDSYTVTGYIKTLDWENYTYTVLPYINGKPVRKIRGFALPGRNIVLPDTVVELDRDAFAGYNWDYDDWWYPVRKIKLGKGLVSLNGAISGSFLEELTVPGNIKKINKYDLAGCARLKQVYMEPGVEYIENNSFERCKKLEKIYIPSSVTYIHEYALNVGPYGQPVIYCEPGSYAHRYAVKKIYPYRFTYDVDKTLGAAKVSAKAVSYNSVKISWTKVAKSDGYRVYRSTTGKEGSFKTLKELSGRNTTVYTDKTAVPKQKYYYRVKAYQKIGNVKQVSANKSNIASAQTALTAPAFTKASGKTGKQAVFIWKKINGATGYQIFRSIKKDSGYERILVAKGITAADKKVRVNKSYYYKIRAYRKISTGKYTYSSFSKPVRVSVK